MAMGQEASSDQPSTPYEEYSGYKVYDENQEEIGKVDDLFIDAYDRPEYMGVKMGFLGSSSTLIPMEIVHVDNDQGLIQVSADKDKIKDGPAFDEDQEIDLDYEARVREHYGLGESPDASERGRYGDYYSGDEDSKVDTEYGERTGDDSDEKREDEEGSGSSTGAVAGAAAGGTAAVAGSGDSDDRDADSSDDRDMEDEGLARRDGGIGDDESGDFGDSESDTGRVKIHKRTKIERPESEEEIIEEEVIIEDADDESGAINRG